MADLTNEEIADLKANAARDAAADSRWPAGYYASGLLALIAEVERRRASASPGAETVEQRVRDLEAALGEISTACEDKALRYSPVQDGASAKRQKVIDYVHKVARDAYAASSGKTGEPGLRCPECGSPAKLAGCGTVEAERMRSPAPVSQKLRVVARPDLETCAHGLRRSDCEWCTWSGTQPAPGPEREEPQRCAVCGSFEDMAIHRLAYKLRFHAFVPAPSPASTPEPDILVPRGYVAGLCRDGSQFWLSACTSCGAQRVTWVERTLPVVVGFFCAHCGEKVRTYGESPEPEKGGRS